MSDALLIAEIADLRAKLAASEAEVVSLKASLSSAMERSAEMVVAAGNYDNMWRSEIRKREDAERAVEVAREALNFYARRTEDERKWTNWTKVYDRYGQLETFDWPGDEADEPWEPAEKALSLLPPAKKSQEGADG